MCNRFYVTILSCTNIHTKYYYYAQVYVTTFNVLLSGPRLELIVSASPPRGFTPQMVGVGSSTSLKATNHLSLRVGRGVGTAP